LIKKIKKNGYQKKPEEFRIKCKNGKLKDVEVISSIVYENSKAVALQGIARDVTEKKEAISELKNQKKFEELRASIWKKSFDIENEEDLIKMMMRELSTTINFEHSSYISIDYKDETARCTLSWDKTRGHNYGVNETIPYSLFKNSFGKQIISFSSDNIPLYAKSFVLPLLKKYTSKSILMVPFGDIVKPFGYLTIEDHKNTNRIWTHWEKKILLEVFNILNLKVKQIKAYDGIKYANKLLEDMNKNLEKTVAERTNEIKLLLFHKDEFINQLGHDLKNPLNPLVNLLPIIEREETDKKKKEMLGIINRNVGFMKNLVTKTIELARLNSSNTQLNFAKANILDEINNVINQNKYQFIDNNIKIKNKITDDIYVFIDKTHIAEVINNLVNNSIKYSKESGTITFDAILNDNFITISVEDDGIGMTKEQQNQIFNEFYKADSSRHDFESSGLGLPITKRIIEKHGGQIWVESKGLDKGSKFYFTLPFKQKEE
jgi:signal transduction histidine kinase